MKTGSLVARLMLSAAFAGLMGGCGAASDDDHAIADTSQPDRAAPVQGSSSLPAGLASCDAMADEAISVLGQLSMTFGTPTGDFGSGGCSYVVGSDQDPSVVNVKVFVVPSGAHSEAWEGYVDLWGTQSIQSSLDETLLVDRTGAFQDVLLRHGEIELVLEASGIEVSSIVAIGEALLTNGSDGGSAATTILPATDPASQVLDDCQAAAVGLVSSTRSDFAAVETTACLGDFALVAWSTSSPRVRVSAVRLSEEPAVLATWGGFEVNEGADPYTVDALVVAGLPADVAAELFATIGLVQV